MLLLVVLVMATNELRLGVVALFLVLAEFSEKRKILLLPVHESKENKMMSSCKKTTKLTLPVINITI